MSTPVATTPRESRSVIRQSQEEEAVDLTLQMQRMINLQYEQQRMFAADQGDAQQQHPTTTATFSPPPPPPPDNDGCSCSSYVGRGTLILNHPEELRNTQLGRRTSTSSSTTLTGDPPIVTTPLEASLQNAVTSYGALNTLDSTTNDTTHLLGPPLGGPSPTLPSPRNNKPPFFHHSTGTTTAASSNYLEGGEHYKNASTARLDDHELRPVSIAAILWFCFQTCCYRPLRSLCCCCQSESLHRSFCYGGIDGMLTGAGIVSAFCGMGLLQLDDMDNSPVRALIVAFTAAACFADSVCMALGHMWTTHVLATAQAAERTQARRTLQETKAQAKSTLVDMLLARGVLKLDAMSLVDTLEGYPDLFVSAMTGDALLAGGGTPSTTDTGPELLPTEQEELRLYQSSIHDGAWGRNSSSASWRGVLSYGRLTEFEMEPDHFRVQSVVAESQKESLCMMLGFSLLSVVPSLIYTWVPTLLMTSSSPATTTTALGVMIHPNTLVIFLTACVMWCLGVWKSRFMDSNWLLFGIETVMVLLVCILCAYGLGSALNALFLPDNFVLQVARPIKQTVTHVGSYYHAP